MSTKLSWSQSLGQLLQQRRRLMSSLWAVEAKLKGAVLGRSVLFVGRPILSIARESRVHLGDDVEVHSSQRSNLLSCFQPSVLRTLLPNAELILGDGVGMSGSVLCAAAGIRIGEGSILGSGAMILDSDLHNPIEKWRWGSDWGRGAKPVCIGRGVFIGARAMVLKGVTVGDRAVIGAGAVVTRDVPAGSLAFGNPAQIRIRSALAAEQ
jgi:acetyltransferase-like isoleucine patch superfamily enzyme